MKMQELMLTCRYSKDGQTVAQIIESSFEAFLKKELQYAAEHLCPSV